MIGLAQHLVETPGSAGGEVLVFLQRGVVVDVVHGEAFVVSQQHLHSSFGLAGLP